MLMYARQNGKRETYPIPDSLELHAEEPLPPDLLDELRDESTHRDVIRQIKSEAVEAVLLNIDRVLLFGTAEQRQARTRAAVRANIRAANKEDT